MPAIFDDFFGRFIFKLIYYVPILLISFPIHEFSHAFVAYRLGDSTAKNAGRLTLNPLKHLDVLGTILILFTGLGWAKPVPINPNNFRKRREGMALSALAGPVSNLLLAFLSLVICRLLFAAPVPWFITAFLNMLAQVNIALAIFNLIPINPLDGSRIFALFLPERIEMALYQYENYIMIALFALLFFTNFLNGAIAYLAGNVYHNFQTIINFIIPV